MLGHLTSTAAVAAATYLAFTGFGYWWVFLLFSFLISITAIGNEK